MGTYFSPDYNRDTHGRDIKRGTYVRVLFGAGEGRGGTVVSLDNRKITEGYTVNVQLDDAYGNAVFAYLPEELEVVS